MAAVQSSKQRLVCSALVNKDKALKEIDAGHICTAAAKRYGVPKSTILLCLEKKVEIVEAVEGMCASKNKKQMNTEIKEVGPYKWLPLSSDNFP